MDRQAEKELVFKTISNVVINPVSLLKLRTVTDEIKIKYDEAVDHEKIPVEAIDSIYDSPAMFNWTDVFLYKSLFDGHEGLDVVLEDIQKTDNIFLKAIKIQIVLDVLVGLVMNLDELKEYKKLYGIPPEKNEKRENQFLH